MDTDKVIQDLNRRFAAPSWPEFYFSVIIFWYDEDKEFEDNWMREGFGKCKGDCADWK